MTAAFHPARRIETLGVSEILAITARAGAMKREGRPVIILGTGEPDFDTPDHIKDAAIAAIRRGETKYTGLDGSPLMKRAIRDKFARENGLTFAQSEVTAGAGAKQMLYNAMMASLNDGDEVIIPTPCWTSYFDIVQIAGGIPVAVPCPGEGGFRLSAEALEAAITPRTRWLMLNSPSNPTGAAYAEEHYRPLLEVLRRHPHVWLMVDDMYEHIVYDGFRFVTPLALDPTLRDRCLTINGVSKAYAMTGWRLGYAGGPAALIGAMAVVQSQSTSCPCSITQAAAIAALDGPQDFLAGRRDSFARRRDMVVDGLNRIDGIHCRRPEGAFYTFADCSGVLGRITADGRTLATDRDFCAWLLDSADVAVVPGSAFGLSPYFRISYATSEAELAEALDRIARACATFAAGSGLRMDAFAAALRDAGFEGEVEADLTLRAAMSTDNSVYRITPDLVVAPCDEADMARLASVLGRPAFSTLAVTARGGGTGTNGQSLNRGVIVDTRRHMHRILQVNEAEGWADVEPGTVLDDLNERIRPTGWFFAPETSTSTRCTIGGMVSTDASGKGSRIYGKTSDNVLGLRVALPEGVLCSTGAAPDWAAPMLAAAEGRGAGRADAFVANTPMLNRRFTGYDLTVPAGRTGSNGGGCSLGQRERLV